MCVDKIEDILYWYCFWDENSLRGQAPTLVQIKSYTIGLAAMAKKHLQISPMFSFHETLLKNSLVR